MKYEWRAKPLAEELRHGSLSEIDKFKYLLFWVVGISLADLLAPTSPASREYAVGSIFSATITVLGMLICFRTNVAGDNRDFIGRFICLSVPICIQAILPFLVVEMAFGTVFHDETLLELCFNILGAVVEVVFFLRLNHFFKLVAQTSPAITT